MLGKKRCSIGKSCRYSCISSLDVCRIDLGDDISESLSTFLERVGKSSTVKSPKEAPTSIKPQVKPAVGGKVATGNTLWARDEASDFDASFKIGHRITGSKDSIDWSDSLQRGTKIGEGTFGTALLVKGRGGYVVKRGDVSTTEAEITSILGKAGLGPKLIYAETSKDKPRSEYGVYITKGRVAMSLVPGKDYNEFSSPLVKVGKTTIGDAYWFLRSQVHKLGVAHNDAYTGNVLIDKNGKARFVDMGLSQNSKKAALSEALGPFTNRKYLPAGSTINPKSIRPLESGDYNSKFNPQMGIEKGIIKGEPPANLQKIVDNLPKVFDALRGYGLSDTDIAKMIITPVRSEMQTFEKGPWAKITNKDAGKVIDILYDGVVDYSK